MISEKVKANIKMSEKTQNLTLYLTLSKYQKELFILEAGKQPKTIFDIIIR
jgi:hypothetical protein